MLHSSLNLPKANITKRFLKIKKLLELVERRDCILRTLNILVKKYRIWPQGGMFVMSTSYASLTYYDHFKGRKTAGAKRKTCVLTDNMFFSAIISLLVVVITLL